MIFTEKAMNRRLGVLVLALSLLGCAQTNASPKSKSNVGAVETAGAEPLAPRESAWDKESREEAEIAARSAPAQETEAVASVGNGTASDEVGPAPTPKQRRHKKKK
jgi:hypothetical protein